ncbi:uncharacterized protein LOC125711751 isoform X2 [Brienomyrus brachyistius]|uniref:uncharacterized protein LOC125711751 isoform X2 n=1 Tax=Brienomyrus brachyistius TaxID=42636 RepID=UPI0020B23A0B|nr:uncharacterized protein LOC125711751 isoform X2 [Brienomyrus brachyistius]
MTGSPHGPISTQQLCQRWSTVLLVGVMWAVCHREAPLFPSLSLSQACQRLWLAAGLWTGLGLCIFSIRTLLHYHKQPRGMHLLQAEEAVERSEARPQAWTAPESSPGLSVCETHALFSCMLVFLCSESMQDGSLGAVLEHADRLERAAQALQKGAVVFPAQPQGGRMDQEVETPAERLQRIGSYLESRSQSLRTLFQAQTVYRNAAEEALKGLGCCWDRLEEMHDCVTMPTASKEQVSPEGALREVESLSVELIKQEERLQVCEAHAKDSCHLLRELSHSQRGLQDRSGTRPIPLWTDKLIQSNEMQLAELRGKFVSLEHLLFCLRTHLEGLRDGVVLNGAARFLSHARPPSPPSPPASPPSWASGLCCPLRRR